MTVPAHGTFARYLKYKCHCDLCRAKWSDYQKAYRARKRERESAMAQHRKTSRSAVNCACGGLLYEDDAGFVYCVSSDALVSKASSDDPRHIRF